MTSHKEVEKCYFPIRGDKARKPHLLFAILPSAGTTDLIGGCQFGHKKVVWPVVGSRSHSLVDLGPEKAPEMATDWVRDLRHHSLPRLQAASIAQKKWKHA